MSICAGIDAGSRAIKVALLDTETDRVLGSGTCDQGVEQEALASRLLRDTLTDAGAAGDDVAYAVATGYARGLVREADTTITEITCHACGVRRLVPDARTVVEIGGQDSKLLRLDAGGAVRDFAMNDRCAAGTGRFLEMVADRLDAGLDDLGPLATDSADPAAISSMCVVFAETEIISLLASGTPRADIVAGVQRAIAERVASMAGRSVTPPLVFTGGVALVPGMADALAGALGCELTVPPDPHLTGALGAAVLAARRLGQS